MINLLKCLLAGAVMAIVATGAIIYIERFLRCY